jgi:hypothetical protein
MGCLAEASHTIEWSGYCSACGGLPRTSRQEALYKFPVFDPRCDPSMNSDSFFLTASTDFASMSSMVESCLEKEGFSFLQNRTNELVEFEIERPVYFRIVVRRRNDAQVTGNLMMPSIRVAKGTFLDVWFPMDQDEVLNEEAMTFARAFLGKLLASLPEDPWRRLGFREANKVKKKWKEILRH